MAIFCFGMFIVGKVSQKYFDKSLKQTAVVAYIDRNKAWRIYESKIQTCANIFLQQYKSAETKHDSLKKYFLFLFDSLCSFDLTKNLLETDQYS